MRIRKLLRWLLRVGGRRMMNAAVRMGGRTAVDTALDAASGVMPHTAQSYTQVFKVDRPVTVYVRGSHCRVTVRRAVAPQVTLEASMVRAFGLEFATEQDDAGVYIVLKRKPVMGTVSRAEFALTVPYDCHLAFNLTPGDVVLQNPDGLFELPPVPAPDADRD
jgi:hypothetical protein